MAEFLVQPFATFDPATKADKDQVGVRTYASYTQAELDVLAVGTPVLGADLELYKLAADAKAEQLADAADETARTNTTATHGQWLLQTDTSQLYYYSTITDAWVTWNGTDPIPPNPSIAPAVGVKSWVSVGGIETGEYAANAVSRAIDGEKVLTPLWFTSNKATLRASHFGIRTSSDNARLILNNQIEHINKLIADHGALDIVFEGGTFDWSAILNMPTGLCLTATQDTTFLMTSASSRFVRTVTNARNCHINGKFIWDGQGFVSTAFLEGHETDGQLSVDGSSFINTGADLTLTQAYAVQIGTADGCQIKNLTIDGMAGIHTRGNGASTAGPSNVLVSNIALTNPSRSAPILNVGHHTTDYIFEDLTMGAYPATTLGGHMISYAGESPDNPTPTILRGKVRGVRHTGRAGVAWTAASAVGATGDIVAFRSCDDFSFTDFVLENGGEFALDAVHGAKNGFIGPGKGVAIIRNMDGAAIVLGGNAQRDDGAGGTQMVQPCDNIKVSGVNIFNTGIDHAGQANPADALGFSSICGIRLLNANNCTVVDNRIDTTNGAGVYVSNVFPVNRCYIKDNAISNAGTQGIGLGGIWAGQSAAPGWDGTTLTFNNGNTNSIHTGVINGIPADAGDGGLDSSIGDYLIRQGWQIQSGGNVTLVRTGTKHFAIDASTFRGVTKGFMQEKSIPAESPVVFQHILSDDSKTSLTSDIDNLQFESSAGTLTAVTAGQATVLRLFFNPTTLNLYLQYGTEEYTNTSAALYLTTASTFKRAPELEFSLYLGMFVVAQAATDYNAASNARWVPARR